MATYYVNTALGTDDGAHGTGSGANAWKTLIYANTSASNGDTVNIENGTYTEANYWATSKSINWVGESKAGVIVKSVNTLRVVYLSGTQNVSFSNMTFQDLDVTAAGANYLIDVSTTGTVTFENCEFDNGNLGGFLIRVGTRNLTINNCSFTNTISSNSRAIYFEDVFTLTNSTFTTADTVHASYNVIEQFDLFSGTVTMTGNTFNSTDNSRIFYSSMGGGVTPVFSNNTVNTSRVQAVAAIECNDCVNEVIENNTINVPSTTAGAEAIRLYSTGGVASVASIKNNVVRIHNNTNHAVWIGTEDGLTSVPNTHDGSVIDNNIVYTANFFPGVAMDSNHAIMAGYNVCKISNNQIYGAGMGIVVKDNGSSVANGYVTGNKIINCAYGLRIKGVTNCKCYGNDIISNNSSNAYAVAVTENGTNEFSTNFEFYNNKVNIDDGLTFLGDAGSIVGLASDYNFYAFRGTTFASWNGVSATLAAWQAKGQDQNSGTYEYNRGYKLMPVESDNILFRDSYKSFLLTNGNEAILQGLSVIKKSGLELSGTSQFAKYQTTLFYENQRNTDNQMSIEIWFNPEFNYDENATRYLYTAESSYAAYKMGAANNNILRIYMGCNPIVDIAAATYSPYWLVGQPNHLVVASNGTVVADTDIYLNNNLIVNSDSSDWTKKTPTMLYIGSDSLGTNCFKGKILSFSIYSDKLTAAQVATKYAGGY